MTMTRTLILLRHAKSAWPQETPDVARPLAARGRRDAPAVGCWLREQAPRIDLVMCSTAVRAVQTWDLAAAQLDAIPRVRHEERLYGASAEDLLTATQELPHTASTAALVGHNPGLEDFLTLLTGVVKPLKTSAIAVITTPGGWEQAGSGSWTLEALATPRGR
ncbi:MAG: histidine phosphatase family protein [Pseudonocardiales bacterium]|nr:histidine phosphatase family protein [Pseudonocardiales bacterium]MBV9728426.1 histidine phosphatase family protein [Pseudonocardiales bacterium]